MWPMVTFQPPCTPTYRGYLHNSRRIISDVFLGRTGDVNLDVWCIRCRRGILHWIQVIGIGRSIQFENEMAYISNM